MTSDNSKAPELKPCPFCGGEVATSYDTGQGMGFNVECKPCNLRVGTYAGHSNHKEMALTHWNTRTPQWNTDMDAAPRDGTGVLTCSSEGCEVAHWSTLYEDWMDSQGRYLADNPTHWMHINPPG